VRIACLGAGPGGLLAALLAKRSDPGREVTVYERNRAGDTFGFGVVFSDATLDGLGAASLLPGWPRTTLLAHLTRNADALVNLLTWARTGVETPMYASSGARDAGIAQTAALPPDELRAEFRLSQARLAAGMPGGEALPDAPRWL